MQLAHYKKFIQERQKARDFPSFIRDICSWYPMKMYEVDGIVTVYPLSDRCLGVVSGDIFEESRSTINSLDIVPGEDFFSTFSRLFRSILLPGFHHYYGVENSAYSNHVSSTSHAYSSFHVTGDCENIMYSLSTKIHAKNIYNSTMSWIYSENIYQSLGVIRSMNIFYSKYIQDSHDIWFSTDLIGCSECISCSGLSQTSYAIENTVYSKDEYYAKKTQILKNKDQYDTYYKNLQSTGKSIGSKNTTGKYCNQSENVENGYYSIHVKDGKNILFTGHPDGLSDVYNSLFVSAGRGYYGACGVGGDSEEIYNCVSMMRSFECYYSYFLERCSFCFGCVGLKNQTYCIYNKQYQKEEWYIRVAEIMEDMKHQGTLGDFFPHSMCPFYFEDTLASLMGAQISDTHLRSPDQSTKNISDRVLPVTEMNRFIQDDQIDRSITSYVFRDREDRCFNLQNMEIEFIEKHKLPLPQEHWLTRIMNNF